MGAQLGGILRTHLGLGFDERSARENPPNFLRTTLLRRKPDLSFAPAVPANPVENHRKFLDQLLEFLSFQVLKPRSPPSVSLGNSPATSVSLVRL